MTKPIDWHIVGASFAGSLLASHLAPYGRVTLIDRVPPGTRLKCGGGLPLATLQALGVEVPHLPVRRMAMAGHGRCQHFPCRYAVVDRRELDRALFAQALAAGVEFVEGSFLGHDPERQVGRVRIGGGIWEFPCRRLILAHGSHAVGLPGAGRSMPWGVALVEMIGQETPWPETLQVEVLDDLTAGYAWAFPVPGGRLNVGIGTFAGHHLDPALLVDWKRRHGIDGPVLARGAGRLPLAPAARVDDGRAILFGDAAGMAYPLNGEGLGHIAELAPQWATAIAEDHDLNRLWRRSATYRTLRFGAAALAVLVGARRRFGWPAYRWATQASAIARSIIRW